jgi:hypothetical protein
LASGRHGTPRPPARPHHLLPLKVVHTFDPRANNDNQKLEINQLPKKEADIIREELVCFHSRRHFTEDVLGIDISLIWNNRCESLTAVTITLVTTITIIVFYCSTAYLCPDGSGLCVCLYCRKNEPSEINTNLDLLSYTAYSVDSVRQTVMGDAFTHWLPLCTNQHIPFCFFFLFFISFSCQTCMVRICWQHTHIYSYVVCLFLRRCK